MKRLMMSLAILCACQILFARQTLIRPLQVGDTLPELLLKHVNNSAEPVWSTDDTTRLLTIIDFISSNCGSCYYPMPLWDSLQKEDPQFRALVVTKTDDTARLLRIMKRIPATTGIPDIPVVGDDTLLSRYFPHKLISHMVWLNRHRKIIAITGSEYAKPHYMKQAMQVQDIMPWPQKKDVFDFDHRKPWLEWVAWVEPAPAQYFYSTFTTRLEGIIPPNGYYRDTVNGQLRFSKYNYDLLSYCQLAVDFTSNFREELFSFSIGAYEKLMPHRVSSDQDITPTPSYCYSIVFPIDFEKNQARKIIQDDVRKWLRVLGVEIQDIQLPDGKKHYRIDTIHSSTKN